MKKVIKGFSIFFIVIFAIVLKISLIFFAFFFFIFGGTEYHIKTEFGDSFTVTCDLFDTDYYIYDGNNKSDYFSVINHFNSKRDIQPVCDSNYFRCYSLQNEKVDMYIIKIKKYDVFIPIHNCDEDKGYTEYMLENEKRGQIIKSEFLCDSNLMEIVLPFYDELYHDDMITIAEKMTAGDFEGLDEYGLTEEMINDTETLEEKMAVMEDYLKNSK